MTLFPQFEPERPPQAGRLAPALRALAERGVYVGTSSWKYEGWLGSIYSADRYTTRGKLSRKKFEAECLAEYAEIFPTVCGDFAFYQFPTAEYWQRLFADAPESFLMSLKVPDEITVSTWPGHRRYGVRAGEANKGFLDAGMFTKLFVRPLERYAPRVGPLIFQFGTFNKSTFPSVDDFLARLDAFLAELPAGFRYAVEIRNPEYLGHDYFALLSRHRVAHVFNAWTRMPELGKQIEMDGAFTADFTVTRALLAKGRQYEQAVEAFEPYDRLQDENPAAREALVEIARRSMSRRLLAFLYINNRLEGNAPTTIEAVADRLLP